MKMKHLFAGLVATLALGAATTASVLIANKTANEASAATNTTVYYAVPDSVVGSYTVKCNVNRQGDASNWQTYNMTKLSETFKNKSVYSATFTDIYDGLGVLQFQLYDGDNWKSQVEPFNKWTSASTYNGKVWEHGGSSWQTYTPDVASKYYVSVNNGAAIEMSINPNDSSEYTTSITAASGATLSFKKDSSAFAVTGKSEANNNVTTSLVVKTGGTFDLYLNVSTKQLWATGFQATTGYIYYVSGESYTTTNYIYTFGGVKQFGEFPGTRITAITGYKELSTVVNFNGKEGYIYKIPVQDSDNSFLLRSGDASSQTGDKTLTLGGTYWWDSTTGDLDATIALDLIDEIETARNAASYTKNSITFNYTVCGISKATAQTLVNKYDAITSQKALAYLNSSTTYTWKDATSKADSNQQNWTFDQIIAQLRLIAADSGTGSRALNAFSGAEAAVPATVAVVGMVSMTAVGGFFFLKKKPF